MTADKLSARVDAIVESFETRFGKQVDKTQMALFEEIQLLLNKLELNADGTIIQNQANRKLLAKVEGSFNKAFKNSGYYETLDKSPTAITGITGANSAYFSAMVEGFKPNAQYIKSLQKQTISQMESLLANDGLEAAIKEPIRNILNQNINTGASYSDLLKQIRQFTLGSAEKDGKLMRYSRQITTDTLFNFSRGMQESISQNLGLKWVKYVGGVIDTSRDFCITKVGGYYKKEEVEGWAKQNWAGKREGTTASTIFIYAGGYQCRHQIIYVSEADVPNAGKPAISPNKPTKFSPAQTKEEASAFFSSTIEKNMGLKARKVIIDDKLTLDQLNARNKQLDNLFTKYKTSDKISTKNDPQLLYKSNAVHSGAITWADRNAQSLHSINFGSKTNRSGFTESKAIEINERGLMLRANQLCRVDRANAELGTVTHEFAHLISVTHQGGSDFWSDIALLKTRYSRELRRLMNEKKYDELDSIFLGDYAQTNSNEFMAEAFTEYELSSNPTKYAVQVGGLIKKYFGKD